MGHSYTAVGWNRQKKIYDRILIGGILAYLAIFVVLGFLLHPDATAETLLIRALGTGALLLLHIILAIGPLCRLDSRFLPFLYNRRHMGVAMFVLALGHGAFSILQFHAFGDIHPILSVFTSNTRIESLAQFPFQPLGFGALIILALMATTSHDFWLTNLSAPVWKALHMLVYLAYALIVLHVALGVLQAETNPLFPALLGLGAVGIFGLHIVAGRREASADREQLMDGAHLVDGMNQLCSVQSIPEKRARVFTVGGERVAVFRYDGKISAVSSVCQHQNGPLGEGCVREGKITCPWHGYEYLPESGASPEPFTEKIPTFRTEVRDGQVWIDPQPLPPGTATPPACFTQESLDV